MKSPRVPRKFPDRNHSPRLLLKKQVYPFPLPALNNCWGVEWGEGREQEVLKIMPHK